MTVQLGPTRRKSFGTKDFGYYGMNGGLNVRSAQQEIGDHDLTKAKDVYLRSDGGVNLRNGMNIFGTPPAVGALILARFYQDVRGGVLVTPESVKMLGQVGNTLFQVLAGSNVTIGAISAGAVNAAALTWERIQDPNNPNYSFSGTSTGTSGTTLTDSAATWTVNQFVGLPITSGTSTATVVSNTATVITVASWTGGTPTSAVGFSIGGLTDVIVICTGSGGPYVYDGTNLYTPPGWSQAFGASWCAVVNGILWFGGIPLFPNQIFGCGDGITASMESLPAYRNFVLSAPVTGLCAIGTGANAILATGRNTGLSLLYGTGPSTFYLQDVPFPDGISAGRSMVSGAGVLYFLGRMAYYQFDGTTTPVRASDKIEPWILNDPIAGLNGYPMTGSFNLTWATIYNNRIHIGYCANGSATQNAVLCLDLVVKGWTVVVPTPGLASMILLDAPSDPSPYQCYVGSATTGQAYQWDYTAPFTNNAGVVLDGTIPVLAQAQSKYFKIGVPGTNKTLTRFYPEFFVSAVPFAIPFTASTDYGNTTTSNVVESSATGAGVLIWDVGLWDVNLWAGSGYTSFNAPASRIDYDIQFEALAVGFSMNAATAPFIWAGGSGSFSQRGRT